MTMIRRRMLSLMSLAAGVCGLERAVAQSTLGGQTKLVGLSVGVDAYQHLTPLQTARQDAESIAQRLSSIGYAMEPHPALADTDGIVTSFASFLQKIDSSSAAFLFLAGHGVQVEGRNYYLPANVPSLDNGDALAEALPLDFFLDALAKARPRQSIVVLDACRDNAVGKNLPGFSQGIASTNAPSGCFIAYSAGFGEFALDRTGDADSSPNGLFTRHLLRHMDGDKRIYDVIAATRAQVIEDAQAIGHQQHPAIYDQSRRAYFLDGVERRDSGAIEDAVGTLERTGIILAATDDYECMLGSLRSPKPDAVRLHRVLTGLGAGVVGLFNPSREDVLEACRTIAERDFDQFAFVWLGRGRLREVQATALIELEGCLARARGKGGLGDMPGLEALTHSDIIESFRSSDQSKAANATVDARPLTLFFDCGLERDEDLALAGEFNSEIRLNDLPDEFMLEERFQNIALMSATRPGQAKPAVTDRDTSSAFVTALINGLGRPGLSLLDLSELVAAEVATLTDNNQSPILVASPKAARRPFVRRKGTVQA